MIASLTTLTELAVTTLYCAGSAVIPVLNAETYLVAMGTRASGGALIGALALAAAAGQMTGKLFFFAIGRGALTPRWLRGRVSARGKWIDRMRRCRDWASHHSWGPASLTFASAIVGLPPLAVWSVLAGTLRMRWWVFVSCGLTGRCLRFAAVLTLPALVRVALH